MNPSDGADTVFDELPFNDYDGALAEHDLLLLTLSTCSFCAAAHRFLAEGGFRFRWIAADELSLELRRKLRNDFIRIFRQRLRYPALVIDRERVLAGFEIEEWRRELEGKAY